MRVIDLLNKIANKEELPTFIKVRDSIFGVSYKFDGKDLDYQLGNEEYYLSDYICKGGLSLNDEVEIIENKKIRKIKVDYSPDIEEKIFYEEGDKPRHCVLGDAGTELLINKINEIIDYIMEGKDV